MSDAVLIVGATSAIGKAFARTVAGNGWDVILAGRDGSELSRLASDLALRFPVKSRALELDVLAFDRHAEFFEQAIQQAADWSDRFAGVILLHGTMSPQEQAARDWPIARAMIDTNYTSAVSLLNLSAAHFEPLKDGFVCAVSSVAGDRGRQSNYIYGSTKAALTTYLSGLRNRLTPAQVAVVTVKPGFVDTAMTWGLLKPGSPVVGSPQRVAGDILKAIRRKRSTLYTPWFWRPIMAIIRAIPEPIFRRMKM